MKSFLAVLGREIAERKLLFVGAAFASLFPIVIPWLPGLSNQKPDDLRGGMALGLALITSSLLALALGTTVIARDLSEQRIGFYFARPVPGWAIWAGKMLGAAFLSLGAGALILLPALIAGGRIDVAGSWIGWGGAVAGALLLLVTGHAVSVMVRSRSLWFVVDLLVLAAVATILWACSRWLWNQGAVVIVERGQIGFAAIFLIAVTLAGLVQVVRGRTDLRRGHRALSLTLWSLLGAAALGYAGYARWVVRVTPEDLVGVERVTPAPAGSWIAIRGPARGRGGYSPVFLFDIDSGRFIKLARPGGVFWYWWNPPPFSRDGSRVVWTERIGKDSWQLMTVDLWHPKPAEHRTSVIYPGDPDIALSPDGRRVAALAGGRLLVDDLDTGRTLVAAAMPVEPAMPGIADRLRFLEPGRVRIFKSIQIEEPGMPEVWRLTTLDLDVASRRILPVSRIELPGDRWFWVASPDGKRAILRQQDGREALLADLETGRTSPVPTPTVVTWLSFLDDARMLRREGDNPWLSFLRPDGTEEFRVNLPGPRLRIGGKVAPDILVIATAARGASEDKAWTSWLLDLRTRRLRRIASGVLPAASERSGTGSPAARLFLQGGSLVLLDPATGRLRIILQGEPVQPGL
jgi:hypothetical protein